MNNTISEKLRKGGESLKEAQTRLGPVVNRAASSMKDNPKVAKFGLAVLVALITFAGVLTVMKAASGAALFAEEPRLSYEEELALAEEALARAAKRFKSRPQSSYLKSIQKDYDHWRALLEVQWSGSPQYVQTKSLLRDLRHKYSMQVQKEQRDLLSQKERELVDRLIPYRALAAR